MFNKKLFYITLILFPALISGASRIEEIEDEFMDAVSNEDIVQVKKFLADGLNPDDFTDGSGATALVGAVRNNSHDIVQTLLSAKANINRADYDGKTALIYAVLEGNKDIAKLLIELGADIDIADSWKKNAIDHANEIISTDSIQTRERKNDISKFLQEHKTKIENNAIEKRRGAIKKIIDASNKLLPVISPIIAQYAVGNIGDVPVSERQLLLLQVFNGMKLR